MGADESREESEPAQLRETRRLMKGVSLPPGSLPWLLREDSPIPPLQARYSRRSESGDPGPRRYAGCSPSAERIGDPSHGAHGYPWLAPTFPWPPTYCLCLWSLALDLLFGLITGLASPGQTFVSLNPSVSFSVSLWMSLHVCVCVSVCLSVSLCVCVSHLGSLAVRTPQPGSPGLRGGFVAFCTRTPPSPLDPTRSHPSSVIRASTAPVPSPRAGKATAPRPIRTVPQEFPPMRLPSSGDRGHRL